MKKYLVIIALLFLTGCATNFTQATSGLLNSDWSNFIENNGTLSQIAFYSENLRKTKELKDGEIIGMALRKSGEKAVKIGDMYAINGLSFIIIDEDRADGHHYVNMHDKIDLQALYLSKNVKFYQFGGGVLASVTYRSGDASVCQSYHENKEILTKIVTNYYGFNSKANDKFVATMMSVSIAKDDDIKLPKVSYVSYPNEVSLGEFNDAIRSENFTKILLKDLQKQKRILGNFVCIEGIK
ncbi:MULTISPECIES: hypothetical protein [unclassified Campylobacter]|uniref:hypothetical protein n=1 Tax=unclassified Campylobacter TaxID=2593542 RepID=UPI003D341F93